MFSKRNLVDIKKSTAKIQDVKKDLATRLKHLRVILDNVDAAEAKGLFEANFSHIYHILYDSFIQAEANLRQRVHKAHKEELENTLWILEQVLSLLPELIHKRWQLHSLGRILMKLLHSGNSIRLRRQAIRYFLMWYQALEENSPDYVNDMFASLVPGFSTANVISFQSGGQSIFHDTAQCPVMPSELLPILPPSGGEKQPEQASRILLDALLEYMVTTIVRLEWHDKTSRHHRCFHFLLEMFKRYYLPKICPNYSLQTSLYNLNLELPLLRKPEAESEYVACRVTLIKWIASYTHQVRKAQDGLSLSSTHTGGQHDDGHENDSAHHSLDSSISVAFSKTVSEEELASQVVRDVLYSSRDNVNFVHEMYRQAFLLNFNHGVAIRKTILMYKDLIQMNLPEMPPYMLEPMDDVPRNADDGSADGFRTGRLRNDSYLGAIHKENLLVRAGSQNLYQIFITHAANVFLLEVNAQVPALLEEQTDVCKRVLNIYRYMVMHTRMDSNTWEQLLLVLLQITSLVLGENPPKKRFTTLGGKLAPAIFQTLIVTWIKANLNVFISRELWDRFLDVLVSLTNWEELIKEWAKTLDTLTRVLARHVYNVDLTDLPLDRLSKRVRRGISRAEMTSSTENRTSIEQRAAVRQDSVVADGQNCVKKSRPGLPRSLSETSLAVKRRTPQKEQYRPRRSHSLDALHRPDTESVDRTRSPSPAPSSGLESTSVKDSPIQLDVMATDSNAGEMSAEDRGVVCGGTIRGWLPDVAVILWKRMLGALGDVNRIPSPKLHSQVFEYLIKLTDTLIKIKMNQGVSCDNQSTPSPPELVPPLQLILPWCFGALSLPDKYENGKLHALRLVCTIMINGDSKQTVYLPHFYRSLHAVLSGSSRPALNTALRYLGPRFLTMQLPGSTLLLLDLVHACNVVLNSSDLSQDAPRTEAVSILADLLSLPSDLSRLAVMQPERKIRAVPCPDIKEHVVNILLRTGRREPTGMARCIALSALGIYVYKELMNQTFHPKVADAVNVILLALKFNNKVIAQLASNILFLLCDFAELLWSHYQKLAESVIQTLCTALFVHAPLCTIVGENDKALGTALLLCLGEWCMRFGPKRLLEKSQERDKGNCLLLEVFMVLHSIIQGKTSEIEKGLTQPSMSDDFDPNIILDNLQKSPVSSPSKNVHCQQAIVLCAKTVLAHLVTHLGHFPMAIGAARLSSLVVEHDDVPGFSAEELSPDVFKAPNVQLFILSSSIIASLIELPALDLPGGGVTAGLVTADKQVRVLLRDLSGKACWDASILYCTPERLNSQRVLAPAIVKSGPESCVQLESMMAGGMPSGNLPQRAIRRRPPNVLPDATNAAPDLDQLDDLLQYVGHTSPECLESFDRKLNEPAPSPVPLEIEAEAIAAVISQRNFETEYLRKTQWSPTMVGRPAVRPVVSRLAQSSTSQHEAFQKCRLLFSQLGLAGWEKRKQVYLLKRTERLLRELRNLDGQSCRETHKIAVIYVAPGQEDKNSILSNQGGSVAYEQFLAALAWEVELEGHNGFLGGLQRQGSTGLTAPYVATSFMEAIFHVATRMPSDTPEAILNKTRHLGNDEVHIVWSEHTRDYRRDIIPTEFCDILITIYPLANNLNRVTVNCKPEVPFFGVLFDEVVLENNVLAGLVRAAAICASRAKRRTLSFYQQYYEERSRSLDTVVSKHKDNTTYEEFIMRVYSPTAKMSFSSSTKSSSGALAAALIDDSRTHKSSQKVDHRFRASDSRGVWFNSEASNVESTSISPRPLKKLSSSLKGIPRRTLGADFSGETPPVSPPQPPRRNK